MAHMVIYVPYVQPHVARLKGSDWISVGFNRVRSASQPVYRTVYPAGIAASKLSLLEVVPTAHRGQTVNG